MSFGHVFGDKNKSRDRDGDGGRSRSGSKNGRSDSAFGDIPWSAAARCALEAGTMAALKSYDKPGAWIGTKGAQIATAAVGAALVDGYIANKNPGIRGGKRHAVLRQVTNAALGNLVLGPAGKTVEQKKPMEHLSRRMPSHRRRRH